MAEWAWERTAFGDGWLRVPRDEPYGPSTACQCISTYRYTIHLCIYPSIHIYLSIHLSIYLSIHLSIYLSTYPSTVAIASSSAASAACSWSVHTARTLVGCTARQRMVGRRAGR